MITEDGTQEATTADTSEKLYPHKFLFKLCEQLLSADVHGFIYSLDCSDNEEEGPELMFSSGGFMKVQNRERSEVMRY